MTIKLNYSWYLELQVLIVVFIKHNIIYTYIILYLISDYPVINIINNKMLSLV